MIKNRDIIHAYDYDWQVLDKDYPGGILCIMSNPIDEMIFSKDGLDYQESYVKQYLEELTEYFEGKGATFGSISLDLIALDGSGWMQDKLEIHGLFLLTSGMYQKYRRYMNEEESVWWLFNKYTYNNTVSSNFNCYVGADGTVGEMLTWIESGVRPACIFIEEKLNEISFGK